jgi:hypothetical protein
MSRILTFTSESLPVFCAREVSQSVRFGVLYQTSVWHYCP